MKNCKFPEGYNQKKSCHRISTDSMKYETCSKTRNNGTAGLWSGKTQKVWNSKNLEY